MKSMRDTERIWVETRGVTQQRPPHTAMGTDTAESTKALP
jgi:hypothetical protein